MLSSNRDSIFSGIGRLAKKLTEASNHYVDWSRVGELLHSNHRYSSEELLTRFCIIAATALSAYAGAKLNDEDKTNLSDVTMATIGALAGFVISHGVVILPLIAKRKAMEHECAKLVMAITDDGIAKQLDESSAAKLKQIIDAILKLSLSTDRRGNASATWGKRKRLLENLSEIVKLGEVGSLLQVEAANALGQLDHGAGQKFKTS